MKRSGARQRLSRWLGQGRRRRWQVTASLSFLAVSTMTGLAAVVALVLLTRGHLQPTPEVLPGRASSVDAVAVPQLLDRDGVPLGYTYQNSWNVQDFVPFHQIPELLIEAFVFAEDQRFFDHRGIDWWARGHAMAQNLRRLRVVRGASTISEQTVRILHPRPRTVRSRWLEGFEARALERRFAKTEILEAYLNQVPYARKRRGVAQAAATYFGRSLQTLHPKEMLALAVLVRSPSALDPELGDIDRLERSIVILAERMHAAGRLDDRELSWIRTRPLRLDARALDVDAAHFTRWVRSRLRSDDSVNERLPAHIRTTLDAGVQRAARDLLDQRIGELADRRVGTGAVLVLDHRNDEILAWVSAGGFGHEDGGQMDKVLIPRQPGSALKPFLYGQAMTEMDWTPATLIEDAPLADAVGHGLHAFQNYSRIFYGPVRLRDALGNSLNTPAVRTARALGGSRFLEHLHALGVSTLDQHPDHYGDGLALGNGEVSLFELTRAYAVLARGGTARSLRWHLDDGIPLADSTEATAAAQPIPAEIAALVTDILADPGARALEFGPGSVLDLPVPAAAKTGTSNDYRDAWCFAYTDRYVIGAWMGNLDRTPMQQVSGSIGPAMMVRSLVTRLHPKGDALRRSGALPRPRSLVQRRVCRESGQLAGPSCPTIDESFRSETAPTRSCPLHPETPPVRSRPPGVRIASAHGTGNTVSLNTASLKTASLRIESPTPGLHLALDPRIPDHLESFRFEVDAIDPDRPIEWWLDGEPIASTDIPELDWSPTAGRHRLVARQPANGSQPAAESDPVGFLVKDGRAFADRTSTADTAQARTLSLPIDPSPHGAGRIGPVSRRR